VKTLAKTYIEANLRYIENLYNRAKTPQKSLFFAKLAILELCGWIEMSMDAIILRCAKQHVKVPTNKKYLENVIIRTHGFEYDRHFREMLIRVVGLKSVERIERSLNPIQFQKLNVALTALKAHRDPQAHTYIKGTTAILDAPSVTKSRFNDVYNGLTDFDRTMRRLGF